MNTPANPLGWAAWAWRCLLALVVAMAVFSAAASLSNFARAGGLLRDLGNPGLTLERSAGTPAGWSRVEEVALGGAAARAGIEPDDLLRLDRPLDELAKVGWAHPVTVEREGQRLRLEVVVPEESAADLFDFAPRGLVVLFGVSALLTAGFGSVLMIRGRRNRAATMLGVILLFFAMGQARLPPWAPDLTVLQFQFVADTLAAAAYLGLWPLFCLEISGGPSSRRQARAVQAVALISATLFLAIRLAAAARLDLATFMLDSPIGLFVLFGIAHQFIGYAIIANNFPRNNAAGRNRLKIVLIAFALYLFSQALLLPSIVPLGASRIWLTGAFTLLSLAALALLVYAVLRHKLFNLNFALNRALVYGAVSFVLLTAFGLAKWAIEHLIPESWHAGSEYYSVAIALALFLVLHRVHDGVERNVEKFVFGPWHENEAALRRFVTAAGHFDRADDLCRAFAEDLHRFAGGAGAALYLREAGGSYARRWSTLAGAQANLGDDDLALALMRAERQPVKVADLRSALPGVLALPMLDHGRLAGFALLDRKGDGTDYRPDELEVLGWAAHQVGLDLQAMRARELEAEVAGLTATVAALNAQLAAADTLRRTRSRRGTAA